MYVPALRAPPHVACEAPPPAALHVQSYHLGGMGCANGVVAINLVSDLLKVRAAGHTAPCAALVPLDLAVACTYASPTRTRPCAQAHPNCNAILACNECTTPAFYRGHDKSRLVPNVLFRCAAAAAVLHA